MTELQISLKKMVKMSIVEWKKVSTKPIEEIEIDKQIDAVAKLPMFLTLSEGDVNEVRAEIKSEEIIFLLGPQIITEKNHKKWFLAAKSSLNLKFWERYKQYLLTEKDFSENVVNSMDDISDKLVDLLGNPKMEAQFSRKGLIIGDVQSGKTANYTALMCKAADVGYKVIVLLTGTIENLRQQTQKRIDEGFVGLDSAALVKAKSEVVMGVGKIDSSTRAFSLTTTLDDFKEKNGQAIGINFKDLNIPAVFVVKKNGGVLRRLNKWLMTYQQDGNNKINYPLLVVDDEADNASIFTKPGKDDDPNVINGQIRELLANFVKSSYVGFTATPFANIFINPETTENMKNEDLFPKDYICCLKAPTNYIGARDIFTDEGKRQHMLVRINNDDTNVESIAQILPYKHKKGTFITSLPKDLKEAIRTFILANAIEDLDGLKNNHRSMLINITRYTDEQTCIANHVSNYVKSIQNATKNYAMLPEKDALQNQYISALKTTYEKIYREVGEDVKIEYSWEQLQKVLYSACAPIEIREFHQNAKEKNIDYEQYDKGIRMIAVGGMSLSRGLTLEGLVVSYFYRNSIMYDTLMQMGRWFGYRPKYEKVCRIFMTEESIQWYRQISEATDELRAEVQKYEDTGLTPLEFGLRVRTNPATLLIVTARNKMRQAYIKEYPISLSGEFVATPAISVNKQTIQNNYECIKSFVGCLVENGHKVENMGKASNVKFGFRNIDKKVILEFLQNIEVAPLNGLFDVKALLQFFKTYDDEEMEKWDIAFPSGSSNQKVDFGNGISYSPINPEYCVYKDTNLILVGGTRKRLAYPEDGKLGLTEDNIAIVERLAEQEGKKTPAAKWYFKNGKIKRNPLLLVYSVDLGELTKNDNHKEGDNRYKGTVLYGLGIGIPVLKNGSTKWVTYVLNTVAQDNMMDGEDPDENDD